MLLNAVSASYATTASYLDGAATTITYIRRSDSTSSLTPNVDYLYCGQAESGSLETQMFGVLQDYLYLHLEQQLQIAHPL